jgi:transcriptional regulator with XRE-family HTH domain
VQSTVYATSIYETRIYVKGQLLDFAKLSFGERLRLAREGAGLTQVELAKILGVAQNQISVWEKGPTGPKRGRLPAIASAVGSTSDWLLEGKGRPARGAVGAGARSASRHRRTDAEEDLA